METIMCKECNKELSKKAIICPNCGVKINPSKLEKIFLILLIIGGISIGILLISLLGVYIKDNVLYNRYSGIWELQTNNDIYYINNDKKIKILIDDSLDIEKENVYYGLGLNSCHFDDYTEKITKRCEGSPAKVFLSTSHTDKFGINFIDENANGIVLCFKYISKNQIEQISCEGVATDENNPNGYSLNGGIDEKLDIVYKKVSD